MALGDDWPELLTVREVAQILRVSTLTIKRWGKKGKLPPIRINSRGDRRYKKEAVLWLLGIISSGKNVDTATPPPSVVQEPATTAPDSVENNQ